jgi:predicted site-specific integrase-resolvase
MINDFDEGNAFGFSLVSEQELKRHEEMLRRKVEEQNKVVQQVQQTSTEIQSRLEGLRNMIMPLLQNLARDPEKTYILWPDRSVKIQAFIEKINKYVDND